MHELMTMYIITPIFRAHPNCRNTLLLKITSNQKLKLAPITRIVSGVI